MRTTRMALPLYPLRSTCELYRRGSVIANVMRLAREANWSTIGVNSIINFRSQFEDETISRIDSARETASELLDELEQGNNDIDRYLMKAKRLARLLRDEDAARWLSLEMKGYPSGFSFSELGSCKQYAVSGGRLSGGTYTTSSMPALEARLRANEATLGNVKTDPAPSVAENYTVAGASSQLFSNKLKLVEQLKQNHESSAGLLASLKGALHEYATNSFIALEFGDAAQSLFEDARMIVDEFVSKSCPEAASKLTAINERMLEDETESFSAALTSCRRLLMSVADSIFPASTEPYEDSSGKKRKVGEEEYKNRILAYLDQTIASGSSASIVTSEIEHLASRLDAVYVKSCKGVHADVKSDEARLAVIHTYLIIAEIARLWTP